MYFDPDAILCEREVVPIRFTSNVFQAQGITKNNTLLEAPPAATTSTTTTTTTTNMDLLAGTRLLCPLYLAHTFRERSHVANVELPPPYRQDSVRTLRSSRAPDALGTYYYDLGMHIAAMVGKEDGETLKGSMLGLYQMRYGDVVRNTVGGAPPSRYTCVRENNVAMGV
eukprot:PhF_6_TR17253/c0_g3_i1/m.26466/K10734/GINS3; GINS complex subunit 3